MSDFDLDAAVLAARQRADAVTSDGTATRLRIRETLERRHARRTRHTTIIAGLLATIFGSTAFAYYSDWRPRLSLSSTPAEVPPAPMIATLTPDEPVHTPARVERTVVREEAPLAIAAIEPVAEPPRRAAEPARAAVPEVPAAPDPELAAYRVAHEAHFRGGSPLAALQAWDAYLRAYPDGHLAIDARWSRALILIKLARYAEARRALQPFADAPAGAYRQAEAARLLAALPRD